MAVGLSAVLLVSGLPVGAQAADAVAVPPTREGAVATTSPSSSRGDLSTMATSLGIYVLSFDSCGGAQFAPRLVVKHVKLGLLPTPVKTGYTFQGWYTSESGGSKKTAASTLTKSTVLYAHWKGRTYTLSFDPNGGILNASKSKKVTYGKAVGRPPTPKRAGYHLTGWYTARSGGLKYDAGTVYQQLKDTVLYARWTANRYTLSFDPNGGTVSASAKELTFGAAVGSLPTPEREGYGFQGWYTTKTGATRIDAGTKYGFSKNTKVYARWAANKYTLTFDPNGGTVSVPSKKVTFNGKIGNLPTPKCTGHSFQGWYTGKVKGTKIGTTAKYRHSKDISVYAHWKKLATKK
jgi:uncharacterized repeat protein (TIGR02543 family)